MMPDALEKLKDEAPQPYQTRKRAEALSGTCRGNVSGRGAARSGAPLIRDLQ